MSPMIGNRKYGTKGEICCLLLTDQPPFLLLLLHLVHLRHLSPLLPN